jgi:hypothetical protein
MADEDLGDVWAIILRECATDWRRNMTVPGLAHVAKYRELCRNIREGAARLDTPYDAQIQFESNGRSRVPVAYMGGVHFSAYRYDPGLSIIRDRATSRMFAISHDRACHYTDWRGLGEDGWVYEVKRAYPLARLAQLLSGHASDWQKRLPDLFRVAYPTDASGDEGSVWHKRVTVSLRQYSLTSATRHAYQGVVAHEQLRAREWDGEPGPLTTHHDDFISHRVLRAGRHPDGFHDGFFSTFVKDRDLVMATCVNGEVQDVVLLPKRLTWCGNDHGRAGIRLPSIFELTAQEDCVHVLSRALGWDSEPRVAEGPGWLVSLLLHGRGDKYPVSMPSWPVPTEDLVEMGAMAKEAREAAEKARAKPYHPIDNPMGFDIRVCARSRPRPKRAAATVAMERMLEHKRTLPKAVIKARRAFGQRLVELHELLEAMRQGRA